MSGIAAMVRRTSGLLTELFFRAFALAAYGLVVAIIGRLWWADTGRYTLVLLLLSEGITLLLLLVARRAVLRDASAMAIVATVYALSFFLFLEYAGTRRFIPEWAGASLQMLGLGWQVLAKLTLGRSFGLLPAARGLVTSGPYRLVRHPIYLGYLVGHVGFLLANFSLRNLVVLGALYTAQIVRLLREEAVLKAGTQSAGYAAYCTRVRWRLLPFVF